MSARRPARPVVDRSLPPHMVPPCELDLRPIAIAASWALAPVALLIVGLLLVLPS